MCDIYHREWSFWFLSSPQYHFWNVLSFIFGCKLYTRIVDEMINLVYLKKAKSDIIFFFFGGGRGGKGAYTLTVTYLVNDFLQHIPHYPPFDISK